MVGKKCGVDEAGRGPVLGPLVVAAVTIQDERSLVELGVRDSKKLSRVKRKELFSSIRELAELEVVVLSHDEIDTLRNRISLNEIEAQTFAIALSRFHDAEIFIDAADTDPDRFKRMICQYLDVQLSMVCTHKADERFPVVSAASIVAKETRDSFMDRISEEMGQSVGSGYANDPVTISFLENWISENGDLPPCARKSWDTSRRLLSLSQTRKLTDWMD